MTNSPENAFNFSGEKLELLDLLLADEGLAQETAVPTISPRSASNEPLPLTFAQQRLWFLEALSPGGSLFNTPLALRLTGRLDDSALAKACQALVQRHEGLRTTFVAVDGTPQQIIHSDWPVTLHAVEVTTDRVETVLQTAVKQPFSLEKEPPLRFHLLRCSPTEHILLIVFHHIIFDGWSANIVLNELAAFYEAFSQRQSPVLPELPIQVADYALWQRNGLAGNELQTQLDYWQNQLAGDLPILQLPTDKPRPIVKTHRGATETAVLPTQLSNQLITLCQQTSVTPFMLLLAAFKVLLHRYTAQEDILVGTPIANRQQPEVDRLIGFFVNTLVLRSQLDGWQPFRHLLAQVRETATAAYDHQDVPFEKLVELLQPERNLSYDPLFQVMFTYREGDLIERTLPNLTMAPLDLDNGQAQFDLTLSVAQANGQFRCTLNYNRDLFAPETVCRMLEHWQTLLTGIVADPDAPVGQLPLLTPAEWQQTVVDWNETAAPLPDIQFTHDLIAQQVRQRPDAPALVLGQQQMSYAELNGRANQLAHALQARGIGPESKVGIFINRSFEMVLAVLGVFKAGAAYVPLDPSYPADRLSYMIDDAGLALVLTAERLLPKLPSATGAVLLLDSNWADQIAHQPTTEPVSGVTADNLAYVIYTSGSTGQPKGVGVAYRGLANLGEALGYHFDVTEGSRLLQFPSFSFDASVADFVVALQNGATLVLADAEELLLGSAFVQLMQQQAVSVVTLPPSALALLSPEDFPALRAVISAGEACSGELVTKWATGQRRFVNGYGPTEGTVAATTAVLTADDPFPVIGRPLPNTQIYLLNEQHQPVPVGVAGEIHIAGIGLARGYLNRPDLTAEKFVPNPFAQNGTSRLYKTGDLGRYLVDGRIEYLGRVDHQVKIRGFRIELGEIEAALRRHPAVQDVLVLVRGEGGDARLVAYVVGNEAEMGDLRPFLSQSLPDYMIPVSFVPLECFLLTPNGKIDRQALPTPDVKLNAARDTAFVAPKDAIETQLVQIWQQILNLPAISTKANYFDIGGHSLQAVMLFAAIEKKLKVRLPVALLFQAPTIQQLAAAIRRRVEAPDWSSLVPIQPQGSKTPLFCVHGGAGHVFHYHELAQQLGKERPFYGLQPKLDEITHQSVHETVEEMAAHYIQEMKMVQPTGPYLLSGFCFGGIVAYEVAQQLLQAGDQVGLLAFIDPTTPQNKPERFAPPTPELLTNRLTRHKKNMAELGRLARLGYILNSGKNWLTAYWFLFYRAWIRKWRSGRARLFRKYINWRQTVPSHLHDFYFMHVVSTPATQSYRLDFYPGEIILFSSTLENGGDASLGWSGLPEEGVRIYSVESTHLGILKRPHIDEVAQKLRQHLEPFA